MGAVILAVWMILDFIKETKAQKAAKALANLTANSNNVSSGEQNDGSEE